jgi:hypothetical protein
MDMTYPFCGRDEGEGAATGRIMAISTARIENLARRVANKPPGSLASGCVGTGRQGTAEVSQAALESFDEIGIDEWLPFGLAARWLGPGLRGLTDAES